MAACGSLQHIFDNPSPLETPKASLDSWKHINPIKAIDDMFSELHFTEKNDSLPSTKHYQCSTSSVAMNSESLSMCTEGLGFESFDDVEDLTDEKDVNIDKCKQQHVRATTHEKVSEMLPSDHSKRSRIKGLEFPPPISSLGMSGKPWVYLESFRTNGRFILREVKIPTQELLHACREDGRLKLQFIQSDDEAPNEEDEDEDQQVKERKNGGEVSKSDYNEGTSSNEIRGESP